MSAIQGRVLALIVIGCVAWGAGCTQNSKTGDLADGTSTGRDSGDGPGESPLAINHEPWEDDPDDKVEEVVVTEPEAGTPEWHIREIVKLRWLPQATNADAQDDGEAIQKASAGDQNLAGDWEKQARIRRERNLQVVELANQAIVLTHQKLDKELVFNSAVHHLLDARLQLALAGEQKDVDDLYEVAEALQNSKPNSEAATEAAYTVVSFAHANAVRYAQSEPQWIQEFARQAQVFGARVADGQQALSKGDAEAETNPQARHLRRDAARAGQLLMAAGQSCDLAHLPDEARNCYQMLQSRFPETPPAQQAAGILRRLQLKGQSLQLAGPTVDGNFVSMEDFRGKTVVVVFWSSQAKPFVDNLPALTNLLTRAQKVVSVVGVNLDTEELPMDQFLESNALNWPQIFYSEPEKRGWNSPLAAFYGIMTVPTIWIVDPQGIVVETDVTMENIEEKLTNAVRQSRKTASGGKAGKEPPEGTRAIQK